LSRIGIVEDHQLLSETLSAALTAEGHEVLVPKLVDLETVAAELADAQPEVVLLDLDLGRVGSGRSLVEALSRAGTRVILVSATTDEAAVGECLALGAAGWVPKQSSFEAVLDATLTAAEGGEIIDAASRDSLLRAWREQRETDKIRLAPFEALSRREAAVLSAMCDGQSVEQIAAASYVSVATVRTQVRAVLRKVGVNSQREAVAMASRAGWS
jgi:two-component system nitrate/nitrite response regulator NarL